MPEFDLPVTPRVDDGFTVEEVLPIITRIGFHNDLRITAEMAT